MARYPNAFEAWYRRWLKDGHYEEADAIILRMKEEEEVRTLEEGECRLRKMLYFGWLATTSKGIVYRARKQVAKAIKKVGPAPDCDCGAAGSSLYPLHHERSCPVRVWEVEVEGFEEEE